MNFPAGTAPVAALSADFNGDTELDLAAVNSDGSVRVLIGNGDGTFQPAINSASGAGTLSVAVGDFNSDGKMDLATASDGQVSVMRGNGDGTFQTPTSVNNISSPTSLAVGDFDANGKLDIGVTSNTYIPGWWGYYGWYPGWYEGNATVLLGNGDSFTASSTTALGYGYHTGAVAEDFNGDFKLDFATLNTDYSSASVLLGDGAGALGAPTFFSAGNYPRSLVSEDFNDDGNIDLVSVNYYMGTVSVLLGNGQGGFGAAQSFAAGSTPSLLAISDFNGDSSADLATINADSGAVSVLLGTGTGSFRPPVIATGAGAAAGVVGLVVGDFNADGRQDVTTANYSSNNLSVLLNDGIWPPLDAPSITIGDVTVTEGNTGTISANFIVSLSAAYSAPVTVHYATVNGSATLAGNDYQAATGTLTFAVGETSKPVAVLVNGDRMAETNESFLLLLTESTNAFLADARGIGSIVDDEPHASIDYGPVYVTEGHTGTTTAVFTVRLSNAYDAPVDVNYSAVEGDTEWWYLGWYEPPPAATSGSDFQAASGTLTFAPGETVKTIAVAVNGDRLGESDEYFSVNLTGSPSAPLDWAHSVGVIVDDEPRVWINGATVAEGNTGTTAMTFTVVLSAASDLPVTVTCATSDGSATAGADYQAKTGSVTFAPGQTSQSFDVLVSGDRLGEFDEYFIANITAADGAIVYYNTGYGTIQDDEPRISIDGASVVEGNTGRKDMTFTVSLSAASDEPVSIHFATADNSATVAGRDYRATSGTLTFAPGETSKAIVVQVKGDRRGEDDEYLEVNLSDATGSLLINGTGYGHILDNEARIRINSVWRREGNRGTKVMRFTVMLSGAYDQAVTFRFATHNESAKVGNDDYLATSGRLTFAPGQTTKTILVTIKGDTRREDDEEFYVFLSKPSSNAYIEDAYGWGEIVDDDGCGCW